jgi:hypothetical protein
MTTTFQAEIIFSIRLAGSDSDVSIRDDSSDLTYNASIRISDAWYTDLSSLLKVDGYKPKSTTMAPNQASCAQWALDALTTYGLDKSWSVDTANARQGHSWQSGGWADPAGLSFVPYAFPLLHWDGTEFSAYSESGVVNTTGVTTDYWIVVQPA